MSMVVDVLFDLFNLKFIHNNHVYWKTKYCSDQSNIYGKWIRKGVFEPHTYSQSTFNKSLETRAPIHYLATDIFPTVICLCSLCQFSEYVREQPISQTFLAFQFKLQVIRHNFERRDRQGKGQHYLTIKQF